MGSGALPFLCRGRRIKKDLFASCVCLCVCVNDSELQPVGMMLYLVVCNAEYC